MKKCTVFLLAAVFLFSAFAGCAPGTPPADSSSAAASTPPDSSTPATTPKPINTEFIDLTGDPYEFSLADSYPEYMSNPRTALEREQAEIYAHLEEKYNLKFVFLFPLTSGAEFSELTAAHQSGTKIADFIKIKQEFWAPGARAGMLRPLNTPEVRETGMDVSDPEVFDQFYTPLAAVEKGPGAKIWGVAFSGKYFISNFGYAYFYNKRILNNFGYSPQKMTALVDSGEWTWSKFIEICETVTEEKDDRGSPKIWGIITMDLDSELYSNFSAPLSYNPSTKKWESNWNDKNLQNAVYFVFHCSLKETISVPAEASMSSSRSASYLFYDGKAAFACLWGAHFGPDGANTKEKMKDDYGLLPIPTGGPGTVTEFGILNGVAQGRGKDLPTKGYKHIIPDLNVYVLQSVNPDWRRACHILSLLGAELTDPAEAEKLLLSYFRGDTESLRIFKTYLAPTADINHTRYSWHLRNSYEECIALIVQRHGDVSAFQECHEIFQKAIDQNFGYDYHLPTASPSPGAN